MAITPSQWSHVLTIPEAFTPSAATSGQTLVVTEGVIAKLSTTDQDTFWNAVQNGGGDVRICENEDGTNQLPVEVVSLDNVARTCVIWTRKPSYDGAGNLYLFFGKADETQPLFTDPFGRNAVWLNYVSVFHGTNLSDSSGNNPDLTNINGALTNQSGFLGGAFEFTSSSSQYLNTSNSVYKTNDERTFSAWIKPKSDTNSGQGVIAMRTDEGTVSPDPNSYQRLTYQDNVNGNPVRAQYQDSNSERITADSAGTSITNVWTHAVATYSTSNVSVFVDGLKSSALGSIPQVDSFDEIYIGAWVANSGTTLQFSNSFVQAVKIFNGVLSDSHIATEYANQSDPASFYGTPTLATTGGGATLIPTLIPSGEVVGTPSVTNLLKLIEPNTIPTEEVVSTPTVDAGVVLISPAIIPTEEVVGSPNLELLLSRIFPTEIATQENFETPLIIGGDRIAIPINDRVTWNRVAAYLRTRKFKGNDNDVILTWLRSEGYIDTFNDAFNTYLEDVEALQGSLTDKYSNWRRQ